MKHTTYAHLSALKLNRKRAISELIAYAMLIGLGVTLSVIVYNWMRIYVMPSAQLKICPSGVSIMLDNYVCANGKINITIANKGLFKIDGYLVKINNETDVSGNPKGLPIHLLYTESVQLMPGQRHTKEWNYMNDYKKVVEVEIAPFRKDGNKQVYCSGAIVRQPISQLGCG